MDILHFFNCWKPKSSIDMVISSQTLLKKEGSTTSHYDVDSSESKWEAS